VNRNNYRLANNISCECLNLSPHLISAEKLTFDLTCGLYFN